MRDIMATLTQTKLRSILKERLKLREPRFALRKYGSHLCGSVISDTFKRKGDYKRQRMIRAALEAELGPTFHQKVRMLLAYTPFDWDIDEEEKPARLRAKAG